MAAFIGKGYQYHKLNKQQLTARDQQHILSEAGLDKKDIKQLRSAVEHSGEDTSFLNSGKRMSFGKMRKIIRKHDPKIAQKLKTGMKNYNTTLKKQEDELAAKESKSEKIRSNIERTRKYDIKRQRSKEYLKERLHEQKLKGLEGEAADHRSKGQTEYHMLEGPDTSVSRWSAQSDKEGKDHETSAQAAKRKTQDFHKLKEKASNLPDLPI